ncbi:hypothetical protein FACS189411_14400 [Bacteroidia bacterium]|nr:hypothetical protein FACS189411_14400 [Bacteroidia bacterium]
MRFIIYYILALFLVLELSSCTSQEIPEPPVEGGNDVGKVTLYFRDSGSPQTRALNDSLESVIDNIDLLAFEASASSQLQLFAYRKTVNQADIQTDPGDYSMKHFTVDVPKDNKYYKYVILANARTETDACFYGNNHIGEEKEELLAKVISSESAFWNVDPKTFRHIPMWGESDGLKTVQALNNQVIYLYRSVAVVDVNVEATAPFDLREIYIYNRPTRGRIAPDMDYFNATQKRFISPSLPASMNIVDKITAGAAASPIALLGAGTVDNEVKDAIFLYETDKYGSGNFLNATCLVLGGYANSQSVMSYFRVDFADYREPQSGGTSTPPSWDQGPPTTGTGGGGMVGSGDKYYPILRNHRYDLKVTGVNGSGSSTPLIAAQTQHSQLITEFTTWNSQNQDVYIDNSQYELRIDKGSIDLNATNPGMISLYTTYPGTWEVGNLTDDWFKCTVSGSNNNGTVTVTLSGGNPPSGSIGYFKIKLMDQKREVISQLIKVEYK